MFKENKKEHFEMYTQKYPRKGQNAALRNAYFGNLRGDPDPSHTPSRSVPVEWSSFEN